MSQFRRYWLFVLLLLVPLAACSRLQSASESTLPASPIVNTATATAPTAPPSEIELTETPPPTVDLPEPSIIVSNQKLNEDGRLLVESVVSPVEGWLVIQQDQSGQVGEIVANISVAVGENRELEIEVDPLALGEGLYASLFVDEGQSGVFEYPGPDTPLLFDSQPVSQFFTVDVQVVTPSISVRNQDIGEAGQIIIDEVVAASPGWVGIHMDDNGQPGDMLAYFPIDKGRNENVPLTINWHLASPKLHAVLYEDAGQKEVFEDNSVDQPVSLDKDVNFETFEALFPPDVFVIHQPVSDGIVSIERATSFGPGWLAIYNDDEGQLGNIIGIAPLEDGINHQIEVEVTESAVTPILFIMLHQDLETEGQFDYPGSDPWVRYHDRLPNPFEFRTDGGNYLITEDQELGDTETVTISLIVVDVDAWVVIRSEKEGEFGEIAGMEWIPAGITRNLKIQIDQELLTSETLYAILHLDGGESQVFNYPEGLDIPLQRNRAVIQSPFVLKRELVN